MLVDVPQTRVGVVLLHLLLALLLIDMLILALEMPLALLTVEWVAHFNIRSSTDVTE